MVLHRHLESTDPFCIIFWLKNFEIVKELSKSKAVQKLGTLLYAHYCKLVGVWDHLGSWQWLDLEHETRHVDSSFCYQ